ncbi:cytochrome C [Opitutaceae bacterium EW11]|nr:cytochrome C [Opitutaceae bacterium EW11]
MRYAYYVLLFVCVLTVSVMGFRGSRSVKPPLEVFPDMDRQAKYKPQSASVFFADGRADRPLPPGVVARGELRDDSELFRGKNAAGQWINHFPAAVKIDARLMERGRERFTIYCQPCHGAVGDGNGITKQYGMGVTPSYHIDRIVNLTDGEIFNTITNGRNTMLPYGDKLVPEDRWAVVAYVRALQRAQLGTVKDVPPSHKSELGLQ